MRLEKVKKHLTWCNAFLPYGKFTAKIIRLLRVYLCTSTRATITHTKHTQNSALNQALFFQFLFGQLIFLLRQPDFRHSEILKRKHKIVFLDYFGFFQIFKKNSKKNLVFWNGKSADGQPERNLCWKVQFWKEILKNRTLKINWVC